MRRVRRVRPAIAAAIACVVAPAAFGQLVIKDDFTGATTQNSWTATNGACLTAGNDTGSVPSCSKLKYWNGETLVGGATGSLPDTVGNGALRFTNGYPGGYFQNGAIVSAFIRGGVSVADATRWEINGTKGHLILTSDTNLQVVDATITGALSGEAESHEIELPSTYTSGLLDVPVGPARNVAAVYKALANDIENDTHTVSDFEHAVGTHRLLDAITRAAESGCRVSVEAHDPASTTET